MFVNETVLNGTGQYLQRINETIWVLFLESAVAGLAFPQIWPIPARNIGLGKTVVAPDSIKAALCFIWTRQFRDSSSREEIVAFRKLDSVNLVNWCKNSAFPEVDGVDPMKLDKNSIYFDQ